MKVTLITVAYNSAQTINDTILSVRSQTYKDLEYIIIDGGSTDETVSLAKAHQDDRITVFSAPDKGIYDAMNKGVSLATGDVIGIINSDDVYEDDRVIADVVAFFKEDPSLDMLYGNLVYVKNNDLNKIVRKWRSRANYPRFFENANVPPHPTLFLKKDVYHTAGHYNINYHLAADYEFMLRVFKKFNFKAQHIERLMVKMRLGGATNKSFKNILNGNKEIIAAWKNNGFKVPLFLMPLRLVKRLIQFV